MSDAPAAPMRMSTATTAVKTWMVVVSLLVLAAGLTVATLFGADFA